MTSNVGMAHLKISNVFIIFFDKVDDYDYIYVTIYSPG